MDVLLNFLPYIGWLLLAIMVLVFIHELGHFLAAKLFGMRVEKFSIGFPPAIPFLRKKIGETEYVVGATPLGGYVKIAGMVDESMDATFANTAPEPWEFRAKPVWQRLVVITAGVVFNMILAALVFAGLKATYGEAYIPPLGNLYVADSTLAWEMGLRTGDRLVALGRLEGERLAAVRNIDQAVLDEAIAASPLKLVIERDGATATVTGPTDMMTQLSRRRQPFGIAFNPAIVGTVLAEAPAAGIGLHRGDRILAIDGVNVQFWHEMTDLIQATKGGALTVRWHRPDSLRSLVPAGATPVPDSVSGVPGGLVYEATLTPRRDGDRYMIDISQLLYHERFSLGQALVAGTVQTWDQTKLIVGSFGRIFTGQEDWRANVGGIISIARVTREAADTGWGGFWNIVAMLSISLAVINILPIPALDGGHVVFLLYEAVARREPSLKVRMVTQQIGMALLLALMVLVLVNDILRL